MSDNGPFAVCRVVSPFKPEAALPDSILMASLEVLRSSPKNLSFVQFQLADAKSTNVGSE